MLKCGKVQLATSFVVFLLRFLCIFATCFDWQAPLKLWATVSLQLMLYHNNFFSVCLETTEKTETGLKHLCIIKYSHTSLLIIQSLMLNEFVIT